MANRDERKAAVKERQRKALAYRRMGASYVQIADYLKCNLGTVYSYVSKALADIPKEEAERLRAIELVGLDELELAFWRAFEAGDSSAGDKVLKVKERRARMFGLDKPPEGFTRDEVRDLLIELRVLVLEEVQDPEARKRIAERVQAMAERAK